MNYLLIFVLLLILQSGESSKASGTKFTIFEFTKLLCISTSKWVLCILFTRQNEIWRYKMINLSFYIENGPWNRYKMVNLSVFYSRFYHFIYGIVSNLQFLNQLSISSVSSHDKWIMSRNSSWHKCENIELWQIDITINIFS